MSTFQNYISNPKKLVLTMRATFGVHVPSLGGGCLGKERPAPGDSLVLWASAGSSVQCPRPPQLLAIARPSRWHSGAMRGWDPGGCDAREASHAPVPLAAVGGHLGDPGKGRQEPGGWGLPPSAESP